MSSQDIIWKNADKSKILPNTIKINGVIEFYNGVISPFNELYIDQKNEFSVAFWRLYSRLRRRWPKINAFLIIF